MKTKRNTFQFIGDVYKEKCPNCNEGATFKKDVPFFAIPVMNESCPKCNYRFEREPGYFIGAMYISYGLALMEGGIAYLLMYLFLPNLNLAWILIVMLLVFVLFAKKNFKWSRILYIHIFKW